ncbi:hypothetical protein H4I96_06744 [Botrytis cinerea]
MQFGLPSRPNVTVSQRRVPRPTQPQEVGKPRGMRDDSAYIRSRREQRRANLELNQQTQLPRPSIRQPSPVPRSKSETGSRETATPLLGLGARSNGDVSNIHLLPAVNGKVSGNVLRRKPSSIAQHAEFSRPTTARTANSSPANWGHVSGPKPTTQASINPGAPRIETSQQVRKGSSSSIKEVPPRIIPELDRYRTKPEQQREELNAKFGSNIPYKLKTPEISPPTPSMSAGFVSSGSSHKRYSGYSGSGYSASPSTRFSESPGPSAYSRDTTPTSMSSVSPSIFVPFKSSIPSRRGSSPTRTRPPVTRRRESDASNELNNAINDSRGLPSLRESVNSSSSNSTVKADGKARDKGHKKKKSLSSLPPSPPPHSSRNPSPAPVHPLQRDPTPAPTGLGIIPSLRPPSRGRVTRTPSPSVDSGKHRFGLFGRRTKTAPEVTTISTEKSQKKGPAAGTGHEGYTRYALRGRTTTRPATGKPRERSLSGAPISKDQLDTTDPFFRDRMSPVIISGGGTIKENRNSIVEVVSGTESNTSLPILDQNISQNGLSQATPKAILQPSAFPKENSERTSTIDTSNVRRPSDSQDEDQPKNPSIAFRRSLQRLNSATTILNIPQPLNIPTKGPSSSISSLDPSLMSGESQLELEEIERGRQAQLSKPAKLEKRARSPRKWNFFHRHAPKPETEIKSDAVPVTIGRQPVKPIPHYAMFEFSDEPEDTDSVDLAEILRDSEVVGLTDEQLNELRFSNYKENIRRIEELQTAMAPSLPEMVPATVAFSPPELVMPSPPQVPQTHTDSQVQREVTPIRPSRLQQVGRIPKVVSARPEATSPISFSRPFARLSTIQPVVDLSSFDVDSVALGASPPKFSSPETYPAQFNSPSYQREFLAFSPRRSPRNNSTATTSSSSTINGAEITAIIPEPDSALAEDEVWDEYDDLIETESTARKSRIVSTTSSYGVPFQYETYQSPSTRIIKPMLQASPFPNRELPDIPRRRSAITSIASSCYSIDVDATTKFGGQDTLKSNPSPTAPTFSPESLKRNDSTHSTKSRRISIVEARNRVLFSDFTSQFESGKYEFIDGLGNDDWSFYAAETYPTCTFYNLSPTAPPPTANTKNPAYLLPPPNHRQIQFSPLSSTSKFPFPSSTFSTVIFRFPSSLTTQTYNHILSESRRVLKPGGYIEITLLDLDIDEGVVLGSLGDMILRGLGARGFGDVKSCRVGIPVVGVLERARSGKEKAMEDGNRRNGKKEDRSLAEMMKEESESADESITRMVAKVGRWWYGRCYEASLLAFESKTKMENDENEGGDSKEKETKSIFTDIKVLDECEKWNASFKLVVIHAQKPVVVRRRTNSV